MTSDRQRITDEQLAELKTRLRPLVGVEFTNLALPLTALRAFEPAQIGTISPQTA